MKKGIVTVDLPPGCEGPRRPVLDSAKCRGHGECVASCPSGAISLVEGSWRVEEERCISCGECADSCPEGAILLRPQDAERPSLDELGLRLQQNIKRRLGRSLAVREVDAGSCNACEVEVSSLTNPIYDIERFGLQIVASPRHADVLLVTGPVTRNMEHPLMQTYRAMPTPRIVIAMGSCACSGGVFKGSYATAGGVEKLIPVDMRVSGCPPTPRALIEAFLLVIEWLEKQT